MADAYDPTKPFNEQVRRIIQKTHPKDGPFIIDPFGKRFRVRMKYEGNKLYEDQLTGTDGIGTKGLIHWLAGTIPNGVQDAFAMTADDLMEGGFEPVYLQDHIMMQEEKEDRIFAATAALADLCISNPWVDDGKEYPIIITGGETAIINTMQGFEMGITMTGFADPDDQIVPNARPGDVLIGLLSSGLHSNGYSFVREEMFDKRKMKLDDVLPWGVTVAGELTIPTHIYTPALKKVLNKHKKYVHGMVHITGGGLAKIKELAPDKELTSYVTRQKPVNVFAYMHELGCPEEKMYTRFNNGIGYVIAVAPEAANAVIDTIRPYFGALEIGSIEKGKGNEKGKVLVESAYSDRTLIY